MRYVKVVCESSIGDIQLETLRYEQVPRIGGVFPPLPSVGMEAEGYTKCKYILVEETERETKETPIGFSELEVNLDEGKTFTTLKLSEGLLGELTKHLGKFF